MTFYKKSFMGPISLHIRFDEIDEFIRFYDGIRYLVLFSDICYDKICDRIKKKRKVKNSSSTDSINHNFARIRIDSYNSLHINKILTFHNVTILMNSVVNV